MLWSNDMSWNGDVCASDMIGLHGKFARCVVHIQPLFAVHYSNIGLALGANAVAKQAVFLKRWFSADTHFTACDHDSGCVIKQ